jgi:hypothetical protein
MAVRLSPLYSRALARPEGLSKLKMQWSDRESLPRPSATLGICCCYNITSTWHSAGQFGTALDGVNGAKGGEGRGGEVAFSLPAVTVSLVLHAKVNLPFRYWYLNIVLCRQEGSGAIFVSWVTVFTRCLCAVLCLTVQCFRQFCIFLFQLFPRFLDIVDWWLVLHTIFGFYLDYRFLMSSNGKFNQTKWLTHTEIRIIKNNFKILPVLILRLIYSY